jgi:hypothetical protein
MKGAWAWLCTWARPVKYYVYCNVDYNTSMLQLVGLYSIVEVGRPRSYQDQTIILLSIWVDKSNY